MYRLNSKETGDRAPDVRDLGRVGSARIPRAVARAGRTWTIATEATVARLWASGVEARRAAIAALRTRTGASAGPWAPAVPSQGTLQSHAIGERQCGGGYMATVPHGTGRPRRHDGSRTWTYGTLALEPGRK